MWAMRNVNNSVAIMIALWCALMLVCLMVVLLYPRQISFGRWAGAIWPLVAIVILIPLMRLAARNRIRHAVEQRGGRVLRMRRLPWWRQEILEGLNLGWAWRGPKYEVEFMDLLGIEHRAICRSSLLHGVEWLAVTE